MKDEDRAQDLIFQLEADQIAEDFAAALNAAVLSRHPKN
jgi:hypothetical protein